MAHSRSRKPRGIRLGWLVKAVVLLLVASAGGYFAYQSQKERNTRRLLETAKDAQLAGEVDRAIEAYGLYLERVNSDINALRSYASLLHDRLAVSRTWIGPAIRALRLLNRIDPQDTQTVERLVRLYVDLREYGLAEEMGRTWVEMAPDEPQAVLVLARASHGNNNNEYALKLLTDASSRQPQEPRFYPPVIELLSDVFRRPQEASEWVSRGLKNAPDAFEVQLAAFSYFDNLKQFDTAQQHLDRALQLAPDTPEVLVAGGRYLVSRGDLQRAQLLFDRAARIDTDAPGLLAGRRTHAVKSGDPELQISVADQLQRASGAGDRTLLAQAAELYLRAGALPQADGCIAALERENISILPKGALDSLRGARALIANQPYAAITPLESALRQRPADLWTLELLARAFVRTGALDEAANLYSRLSLLAPTSAGPRLSLARLEIQKRKFDRALEVLATVPPMDVREQQQAELLSLLAQFNRSARIQSGKIDKTKLIADLESIAAHPPADITSLEIMAHAFVDAGLPDRAMESWQQWSTDSSTRDRIALDIGRRLIANQDLETAQRWSQALLATNPDSIEGHLLHSGILLARGNVEEVRKLIARSTISSENQGLFWELLAEHEPDTEQQLVAITRAAELRPGDISLRQKLARRLPDVAAAKRVVEQIRAIEGDLGIQWKFEYASTLLRLDPSPQAASTALELLRQCLDVRPGWVAARGLVGFAYEKMGALPEAVEAYRAALALNPDLATHTLALRLVETLKRLGRFEEADAALAPIARAMPESIDVQRLITEQHVRRQDLTSAAAVADRVLSLAPQDPSWAALTADLHVRAGEPARGEQTARDALVSHPDSLSIAASLVRALMAQNKSSEAEVLARQLAASQASGAFDVLLARVLVDLNRVEEAVQILESALTREPTNASLHASAAEFWGSQGNRSRQLEYTRKTLQLQGDDPSQSLWLAGFLAGGTDQERKEATAIISRRLSAQPDDAETLQLEAQLALTDLPPDAARAEAALKSALKSNPRSISAHKMLAAVLIQKGEIGPAHEAVGAGLLTAGDDPDLLVLSAELHQHQGSFELSMNSLRRVFTRGDPPHRAFELLATAAIATRQVDQAIEVMKRVPDRRPEVAIVLARLYESMGNTVRADELLLDVARQNPSDGLPARLLFLARLGDFAQIDELARGFAVKPPDDLLPELTAAELLAAQATESALRQRGFESLERIATKHPDAAADARFRAGLAHLQRGDLLNAETMLLSAHQLAPLNPRPINALAWLYGEEMGDYQRGLDLLRKYESAGGPLSTELLDTHGALLFRAGRFEEATQKLNACLRMTGQSADRTSALFHLALVQYETGAAQDAATNLKAALQLNERVGGLSARQVNEGRRLLDTNLSRG